MNNTNQLNSILAMFGGGGLNIENIVRNKCKNMGIDVNEFMSEISKYK